MIRESFPGANSLLLDIFSFIILSNLGMWPGEAFYLPDPCELTFANTLLLSNAAISLGNAFINLEISSQYLIFFTSWSFYLSSLLLVCRLKNFVFSHIQFMIHFIVVFSFFLQHYISFIKFLVFYYILFLCLFRSLVRLFTYNSTIRACISLTSSLHVYALII